MNALINRRAAVSGLLGIIASSAGTSVTAQRGRRDASTASDSSTSSSSGACVVMEDREGAFVLEGRGQTLTEPFAMQAGVYRIEVELSNPSRFEYGFWIDFIRRDTGDDEEYFAFSDPEALPETASGSVEFMDAEYVAEQTTYGGDWKIVLSPI